MDIPLFFFVFDFHTRSREIIDIFPCFEKTLTLPFLRHCYSKIFQSVLDGWLASRVIAQHGINFNVVIFSDMYINVMISNQLYMMDVN